MPDPKPEDPRQRKTAAIIGLLTLVAIGVFAVAFGSPIGLIPLVGAAVVLILLYTGRLGG